MEYVKVEKIHHEDLPTEQLDFINHDIKEEDLSEYEDLPELVDVKDLFGEFADQQCDESAQKPDKTTWFKCPSCNYQSNRKWNLKAHILSRHEGRKQDYYYCKLCPYRSLVKGRVKKHTECHYLTGGQQCPYCTYKAIASNTLSRHLKCHGVVKSNFYFKMETSKKNEVWTCSVCSEKFKRKDKYKQHLMCHQSGCGIKCPLCSFAGTSVYQTLVHMKRHAKQVEADMYECPMCNFVCPQKKFQRHLKFHLSKVNFCKKKLVHR